MTAAAINESPLIAHAREEMQRAGLFDSDADYGGAAGGCVMALIKVFAEQRHSGMSAMLVRDLFHRLAAFEVLTPITADPSEWIDRSEMSGEPFWQNRRNSRAFSRDGGTTWWEIDEAGNKVNPKG